MKSSALSLAVLATPLVAALSLAPRAPNPRVVGFNIARNTLSDPVARDRARLRKRLNTVSETLTNEEVLYYANITLGTPEQQLSVTIDTGSSDLWVNTPNSSYCSVPQQCTGGTYNIDDSSSAKIVNSDFNISYVDGSGSSGDYVTDTLHFGGVTVDNFQFGVGTTSSSDVGVLGISYATEEAIISSGGQPYANLPIALVNQGSINTPAYSLWLNDLDAATGVVLFGGVNTAKYSGDLVTVPILAENGVYQEFAVALTQVQYDGSAISSSSLPAAVILDSGTSFIYLPDDIVKKIYDDVDVVYDQQSQTAYTYCSKASEDKSVSFTFSGQEISVPFNELILDAGTDQNGNPLTFKNGKTACIFAISGAGGSTPLLGDAFLRSAYVVYDMNNNEISIAKTVFNSTSDDIREITNGTSGVPGAVAASTTVTSVVNQATGGVRIGGEGTQTGGIGSSPTGSSGNQLLPNVLGSGAGMAVLGLALAL